MRLRSRIAYWLMVVLLLAVQVLGPAGVAAAAAERPISVTFNGHPVWFDVQPQIVNGRTLVPFRAIFQDMGATVSYDQGTQKVTATRGGTTIELTIGSATAYVDGSARTLDVPPEIRDGRTLVPVRFISEAVGARVDWDDANRRVVITDPDWPRRGGSVALAMWSAPEGKYNAITYTAYYDGLINNLIYDGLYRLDDKLSPQPNLATHWETSADNRTYTFYLRRDVKWHDGTPFTARDVEFTFRSIMHKDYVGTLYGSIFDGVLGAKDYHDGKASEVAGLKVIDDYTVSITTEKPNAPFFLNALGNGVIPRHVWEKIPPADWNKAIHSQNPVGTGPFKFNRYVTDQFVYLTAYDGYHDGRPYIDEIVYKILAQETALAQLQAGSLDVADVQVTDIATAQADPKLEVVEFPNLVYQYMGMNTRREPFDDKRVRQAASHAIDKQAIINDLLQGHAGSLYAPIHPLTWAYSDDVPRFEYDPARAKALLDEAGWREGTGGVRVKDGKPLSVKLYYPSGNRVRELSAPVIQAYLKAVGFDVEIERQDFATLVPRIYKDADFQAYLMGWSLNPEPDPSGVFSRAQLPDGKAELNNSVGWAPDESEALLRQGMETLDQNQRVEIYARWQKLIAEEQPYVWLYAPNQIWGFNTRLKNFQPRPDAPSDGNIWNSIKWYVE